MLLAMGLCQLVRIRQIYFGGQDGSVTMVAGDVPNLNCYLLFK